MYPNVIITLVLGKPVVSTYLERWQLCARCWRQKSKHIN